MAATEITKNVHEIIVSPKAPELDVAGHNALRRAQGLPIRNVQAAKVYWLEGVTESEAALMAQSVLTDPVTEVSTVNPHRPEEAVDIAYHPVMTDPVESSLKKVGGLLNINVDAARMGHRFVIEADTEDARNALIGKLHNPTIQRIITETPDTLKFKAEASPTPKIDILSASDEELMRLSTEHKVYLDLPKMKALQGYAGKIGRSLTYEELQYFGGAWSDHCAHITFNSPVLINGELYDPLFKQIKDTARPLFGSLVKSAFHDNSGVVGFYGGWVINMKGETHISPSAVEPINGAATGGGGNQRDIVDTGKGGFRCILQIDQFGVAKLSTPVNEIPPGSLDPTTILTGIVEGTRDFGNPMGIPTRKGSTSVMQEFIAKPTVLVAGFGLGREEMVVQDDLNAGDRVLVIGGRTGRDGIHGATFSSVARDANTSEVHSAAVQIAEPIVQHQMFEATDALAKEGLIKACTDFGAAGFGSAFGEIHKGRGIDFDLANALFKYGGMSAYEMMMAESQQRTGLVIKPEHLERVKEVCKQYGVEVSDMGQITDTGRLVVRLNGEVVVNLESEFIKNGMPLNPIEAKRSTQKTREIEPSEPEDYGLAIQNVLSHPDVCSRQQIDEQYDWGVQGMDALSPYTGVNMDCPNDATVIAPVEGEKWGLVTAHTMNPRLSKLDPYKSSLLVATDAKAKLVAVGGNPAKGEIACLNNYISGKPQDPEIMAALTDCVDGVCDAMKIHNMPVISGKDSCSSSYIGADGQVINVIPYVSINVAGRIPNVEKTVSADIKQTDSILVYVGTPGTELGGSVYYDSRNALGNDLPKIDPSETNAVFDSIHQAIQTDKVLACKTISKGGAITTLTQMAIGGDCGLMLKIPDGLTPEQFLFSEKPGNFIVEVANEKEATQLFKDVQYQIIAQVQEKKTISIGQQNGDQVTKVEVDDLAKTWKEPMEELFR